MVSHTVPKLQESFPDELKIYIKVKDNMLPEGPDFYLKRFYMIPLFQLHPMLLQLSKLWSIVRK